MSRRVGVLIRIVALAGIAALAARAEPALGAESPGSVRPSVLSTRPEVSAAAGARIGDRSLDLTLTWFNAAKVSATAVATVRDEVARVFRPIGVGVSWKEPAAEQEVRDLDRGVVKLLLLPTEPTSWGLDRDVLGFVVGEETPGRVVFVFFRPLARLLGKNTHREWVEDARDDPEVARALGRVIAHELVHAFAPDHPHAPDGVMGGTQSRDTLLRLPPRLSAECVHAFLKALECLEADRAACGNPTPRE